MRIYMVSTYDDYGMQNPIAFTDLQTLLDSLDRFDAQGVRDILRRYGEDEVARQKCGFDLHLNCGLGGDQFHIIDVLDKVTPWRKDA